MSPKRRFRMRSESNDNDENSISDISDVPSPEQPKRQLRMARSPVKIRNKFTPAEDKKMLKYIMDECRYTEIKGLALWKDMEILQITSHTKQSMKCRFLKTVIPNLHKYDIPKGWVERLKWLLPESQNKHPDKENAKTDFTPCSLFDKWRKQSPRLRSSSKKNDKETAKKKENGKKTARAKENGKESANENGKESANENDMTEEEETSANEAGNSETTLPYMNSPVSQRRRNNYKQSLRFSSSSESEADEEAERNVSSVNATSSAISPAPSPTASPSQSAQERSRRNSNSDQSALSDYDQYLVDIAQRKKSSGKKNSRSSKNSSQSEKSSSSEEYVPDSVEEMDQDDAIGIQEDRKSRLQHRRHTKKVEKAFAGSSTSPTSSHKQLNLAKFVTNSVPEEEPIENTEDVSPETNQAKSPATSPAKIPIELSEYQEIISDIAQLYGLTKREVLSTIFNFNGNIEKTILYIKLGSELSQLKPWTKEEDQIISSTDERSIKTVAKARGNKLIAVRLRFLENFPDDFII